MSIQICILENGETVIADIREAIDTEKNESLGYIVNNPFIVEHDYQSTVSLDENNIGDIEDKSTVSFKRWAPLARRYEFNYPHSFVRVIYEPHVSVVNAYISLIQQWTEKYTEDVVVDKSRTNYSTYNPDLENLASSQVQGSLVEGVVE